MVCKHQRIINLTWFFNQPSWDGNFKFSINYYYILLVYRYPKQIGLFRAGDLSILSSDPKSIILNVPLTKIEPRGEQYSKVRTYSLAGFIKGFIDPLIFALRRITIFPTRKNGKFAKGVFNFFILYKRNWGLRYF